MVERTLAGVDALIRQNATRFDSKETISVRPRPAMVNGQEDWNKSHIEVVARRPAALNLPAELAGVPIVKVAASLEEQALWALAISKRPLTATQLATEWRTGLATAITEAPRDYTNLTYRPFDPTKLKEVNQECELILQVSPDDAWPVLKDFLSDGDRHTVGMYDFTAPHIIEQFTAAGGDANKVSLCLGRHESLGDGKKANDWPEDDVLEHLTDKLGSKFKFAWASTGSGRQFASAYHIKVAVKDRDSFWLSSGNWQSSNQPDRGFASATSGPAGGDGSEMAKYNREWHVVVKQPELAGIFEDYIVKDLDSSALDEASEEGPTPAPPPPPDFPPDEVFTLEFRIQPSPMVAGEEAARSHKRTFARKELALKRRRIMPLLTPDNYAKQVADLLERAESRLWFQNQSLSINVYPSPAYRRLLDILKQKAWAIDDCRIIFRDIRKAKTIDALRLLDRDGFPMDKVRVMGNCHTKGILIDSRWTVVGSHNWTNEGTNFNRDASLIIDDTEVTKYFEEIVEHDWAHLSYRVDYDLETPVAVLPLPGEPVTGIPERLDASLNEIDDG